MPPFRSWFGCALALVLAATCAAAGRKPNILFILTDDQGWPTLSCYGNRLVATPHLDSLARDGVRFTDAYVMPQCTPMRAALLSGQHTARNGMSSLLSATGARAPAGYPVDGVDLRSALAGTLLSSRALYWHMPLYDLRWAATPCAVIRDGDWKLIEHFGDSFDSRLIYRPGTGQKQSDCCLLILSNPLPRSVAEHGGGAAPFALRRATGPESGCFAHRLFSPEVIPASGLARSVAATVSVAGFSASSPSHSLSCSKLSVRTRSLTPHAALRVLWAY